ncbi:MAG: NapC/NirT family cytochrome c [Deltaproteobacteria bacterium]|nr:NapC/NirT family cytochrome c [Deltaproteobacteria bacterium]
MKLKSFIKDRLLLVVATSVVTLVFVYAVASVERHISSYSFCVSCHSMTFPDAETKRSRHYGTLGVNPECQDCHLPPGFVNRVMAHVFDGLKDSYGHFTMDLSTVEKFDDNRAELAHTARIRLKKTDSAPCRVCHKNPQPGTQYARDKHKLTESGVYTCIDCHQNLVHKAVLEEDLTKGVETGRIVLKATSKN